MDRAGTPHTPHGECPDRAFMSPEGTVFEDFGNGLGVLVCKVTLFSDLFLTAMYIIF